MADRFAARPASPLVRPRAAGLRPPTWLPVVLLTALLAGCQEKLTSPGQCPELCPGGQLAVVDTVLEAIPNQDSSFAGYVSPIRSGAMLVSSGLPGSEDRGLVKFVRLPDTFTVNGVAHPFTIDSVAISFYLQARDTNVSGVRAVVYRLPVTIDSTTTFGDVEPELVDANLVDTVSIPTDSVGITVRTVVRGAKLSRLVIPPGDSGVLALGLRIATPVPTGVRFGTVIAGTGASVTSYVTLTDVADSVVRHQSATRSPSFNSFVSQGTPAFSNDLLSVGGEPSSRSLIRFDFPAKLRDSVSIVRATLELVPVNPLYGLANDPTLLFAQALRADLGAKSPLCIAGGLCGGTVLAASTALELPNGSGDTVHFEVPRIVRTWQGTKPAPSAIFLTISPEAATFMRPVFFSTRSGTGAPRLRLSYVPLPSSTSP